jgi:hypothetical protein
MIAGKAGAYPNVAGASLYDRPLALSTNIILGRKSLPGTNAVAYYEKS